MNIEKDVDLFIKHRASTYHDAWNSELLEKAWKTVNAERTVTNASVKCANAQREVADELQYGRADSTMAALCKGFPD